MARLYADEDFSQGAVEELRRLGHDVLTARDAGRANQHIPDSDQLAFAISQDRAIVSFNYWDFIKLHTRIQPHTGIIVCTRDDDTVALVKRIDQAIAGRPTLDNELLRIRKSQNP